MPTLDQLRAITQSWSSQFLEWIQGFPLPLLRGELFLLLLILMIIFGYQKFKSEKNQLFKTFWERCIGLFEMLFEKIYGFFTDIIWEKQKYWVKSFVIWVFFVILFANLIGVLFDFLGTMFPWLENYITAPTSDTDFNIAMAIVVVWLVLILTLFVWIFPGFRERTHQNRTLKNVWASLLSATSSDETLWYCGWDIYWIIRYHLIFSKGGFTIL